MIAALLSHKIDVVLDVGANAGQYVKRLRSLGYRGRVVSFEPVSAAHEQLTQAARRDALWDVADRMAIGAEPGEVEIHISGNSVSSSVLSMCDAHVDAAPHSAYVRSEMTPVFTLDAAAGPYIEPSSTVFLKIDTQGYEDHVLKGASDLLRVVRGLQIELSFIPLYKGQRLYHQMIEDLRNLGFEHWIIAPAFVDNRNGRWLQVDATFFRAE